MGIAVVSIQTPHNLQPIQLSHSKTTQFHRFRVLRTHQSKPVNLRCSASAVEEGSPRQDISLSAQSDSAIADSVKLSLSGCKACGRQELEKGCNGNGRIQGGIGSVPGFGWWPIKAYRPCPGLLAAGGQYQRQGQSMDEVAFGRGKVKSSEDSGL